MDGCTTPSLCFGTPVPKQNKVGIKTVQYTTPQHIFYDCACIMEKIYVGGCIIAAIVPTFFLLFCYPCILLQFLLLTP